MALKTSSRPFSTQPTQNQHPLGFFLNPKRQAETTINPPSPETHLRVKAPSFDILQVPEATGEEQGIHTSPIWTTHPICHPITVGSPRKERQPKYIRNGKYIRTRK